MPFTFSHPAIILPLQRIHKQWFSLTSLVIGSLTPDFEYFLRMEIKGEIGHTLYGLFLFCLPVGIVLTFIFHNIVRNTLFDNLPLFFKERFVIFKKFNWNNYFKQNWFVVISSIIIGAFSHLFWDAFTHYDGFFVALVPLLKSDISILDKQIPVFKILQHLSTLIGAVIIFFTIYKLPLHKTEKQPMILKYWLYILIIAITIVILRFAYGLKLAAYGNVIVTIISAIMIGLILTPFILSKKKNLR